ncbi:MAG: FAD-dependent monooxygenase [Myxococcota bacterium]
MKDHAVVIAGGGPTGLMLAAELALARVDVAIVERRLSQDLPDSRAGGLHARTIEVLDQRGVAERFLSQGRTAQVARFGMTTLDLHDFPTRHPYGLALWQKQIERILAEWVLELGVPTYRGVEVTGFRQGQDDVQVLVAPVEGSDGDPAPPEMRAQYLVGCDGGRSLVRKLAGIDFLGWEPSVSYLIAEASLRDMPPSEMRHSPRGVHAIGKFEEPDRARMVLCEPEVRAGDAPSVEELRTALVEVYGTDFGLHRVTWLSRFTDGARQATAYRAGRVLLAGDAAHIHSPTGGQGLNLGVQDAVNLGWKLAQVVQGNSPQLLLDTYHAERHPVGARVLKTTLAQTALARGDDRTTVLREMLGEMLALEEPRKRYAGMMSGLDIHYDFGPGHPLLGRRMPDLELNIHGSTRRCYEFLRPARPVLLNLGPAGAFDLGPWSDRVVRVEANHPGIWELPVLGKVGAPSAVLIRPDGHVAWVGEGAGAEGLSPALERWFGLGAG